MYTLEQYQEFINPYTDKLDNEQQHAQAQANIINAMSRDTKLSHKLQRSFYYHLCAEYGISWQIARMVYATYINNRRLVRLQQLEQSAYSDIQESDIRAMAYHF